jgi:hypothetical protein
MVYQSLEAYSRAEARTAERALDMLDRLDERIAHRFTRQRGRPRRSVRVPVKVCVATGPDETDFDQTFTAWARSVSEQGLSFICPQVVERDAVVIGLPLPDGSTAWTHGEIVRRREMLDTYFWEHGIKFLGRAIV